MAAQILGIDLVIDTATLVGGLLACLAVASVLATRPQRALAARTPVAVARRGP
jgi:hypothetical protein